MGRAREVNCGRCGGDGKVFGGIFEKAPDCPTCEGTGKLTTSSEEKCERCGGDGLLFGGLFERARTCPKCEGTGYS